MCLLCAPDPAFSPTSAAACAELIPDVTYDALLLPLLLSNARSMQPKHAAVMQAVALLCSVLSSMEMRFSVVRFGRKEGQQVLKPLESPFTSAVGQFIMVRAGKQAGKQATSKPCNATSVSTGHLPQ